MNSTSISIASNISAFSVADTMLIKETYQDVPTKAGGKNGNMRIYVIEPNVPEFPEAKFPGVVVFSEVSLEESEHFEMELQLFRFDGTGTELFWRPEISRG